MKNFFTRHRHPLTTLVSLIIFATASATYGPGERCRGAPGYPAVPWHSPPCAGGAACDVPDPEYGFRCPETYHSSASCYKTGERAQGAPGKPAVEWRPCCDQKDEQLEKDEPGAWGKFCLPSDGCTDNDAEALDPEQSDEEEEIGDVEDILAPGVEPFLVGEQGNVSVVACSETAVLLTSSIVIGRLLINLDGVANGTGSADDCALDGCGFLYRFAVSQEPTNILEGVSCPDGAQCFLVQTNRASLSDMFGPEVLINAKTGQVGTDVLLEEIIGCDSEFGDTLSVRQGIQTSARQLPIVELAVTGVTVQTFFDQCADLGERMWRKNSLVGCPFSDECDDNPEKTCYHCTQEPGSSCNNGCGSADGITLTSIPGVFDFANSCCGHDFCYDSQAFSRSTCDRAMHISTVRSCFEGPVVTRMACLNWAGLYRGLLWLAGGSAFNDARLLQEAHLESCKESPSPSPEPTSVPDEDMVVAGMFTDPHLRTFDQLAFDCQASGEFILARSASDDFMLQGRFSGQNSDGSVLTGIALQDGNSPRLEVSVVGNFSSDTSRDCLLQLVVDGALETFESASLGVDGSSSIDVRSSGATITTARGVTIAFSRRLSSTFGCYLESFSVSIPVSEAPKISGLLGTPNRDQSDDWQRQDGTVVPLPENRRDRLFQAAYTYCTTNWCIRDAESSLFSYFGGQSHADFDFCDRSYAEPDLSSASNELLVLCGGNMECLIDGVVGDVDDASAGRDALVELETRLNFTSDPVDTPMVNVNFSSLDGDILLPSANFTFLGEAFGVPVVACSESAVLLTRSIPIGNILFNIDGISNSTTSSGCFLNNGCGPLFRIAVSQRSADLLGSVSCPEGSECFLVQTDSASFGDIYTPEFLASSGVSGDMTIDDLRCDSEEIDDAASVRQSVETESDKAQIWATLRYTLRYV